MYKQIMVPVDLSHQEHLGKALKTAGGLAKHFTVPICFVSVTTATPSEIAHNPQEFATKLQAFAESQGAAHGVTVDSKAYTSHDPAVDLDNTLTKAIHDTGADLVVMASHIPGVLERVWSSHAGRIANHADVSVFVVR